MQIPENQMSIFEVQDDKLRGELTDLEIEKLTPIEALNKLNELKKKVKKDKKKPHGFQTSLKMKQLNAIIYSRSASSNRKVTIENDKLNNDNGSRKVLEVLNEITMKKIRAKTPMPKLSLGH